jgi:heavy metal translocating P-type ATPase
VVGRHDDSGPHAWNLLRLGLGALLAMQVMALSLLLYTEAVEESAAPVFRWVLLGLATPAMLILGYPFAMGCAAEVRRRQLSLDTLIALGTTTAYLVSAVNTIRGAGHIYFDTATMLLTLVTFGKLIEATAKGRAGRLVRSLETLLPPTALRLDDGRPVETPIAALQSGDAVLVRPGERFPADGLIIEGATTVEEAPFTGEAEPRVCAAGDRVIAGSVNGPASVFVRAQEVGADLLLHRIVRMVEAAQAQPALSQRLAERLAAVFVPVVLGLSTATGAAWLISGQAATAGLAALSVLVVACPCAMGIAAPLATAVAIARAAREGIVVRGGDVMERLGQLRVLLFDKTGTLTTGAMSVARVETLDPEATETDVLGWLAGLEQGSEHAIARAVLSAAAERGIPAGTVRRLAVSPGRGLQGEVTRTGVVKTVCAGSAEYVGLAVPAMGATQPHTQVLVAWDGRVQGAVFLSDPVREGARKAVAELVKAGIDVQLVSGDRPEAVARVAHETGIARWHAQCLPDRKIALVRAAKGTDPPAAVGMAGDGVNDAPALAEADIGIAFGAGTELARQSGNVVLLGNHLRSIPWLVGLSRRARRVVRQNLLWAFGYNLVALTAAAGGFLHPLLAALAMVVSSLTVVSNSARLARRP